MAESSEFKSSYLCLKLRGSLFALAVFKVIGDVLVIPALGYLLLLSLVLDFYGTNKTYLILKLLCTAMIFILFILFITDFLTSILFIFGGYDDKKNAKLIRRYYKYNIAVLIVTILMILTAVALDVAISKWFVSDSTLYFILFGAYLVILVVQAYFILLLRSEVVKLQRNRAAAASSDL